MKNLTELTILLTVTGSRSKRLETPLSDTDLLGVYIPDYRSLLGFRACPEVIKDMPADLIPAQYHDAWGDNVEGTLYSLHKVFAMMTKGSPNLLPMLFGDGSFILRSSPQGSMLRKVAPQILNQQMVSALRGAASADLIKAERRADLEQKLVASALYALIMADQMMRGLSPVIPEEDNIGVLRGIRSGDVSLDEARRLCEHYFKITEASDLPPKADEAVLNEACIEIMESFYDG